MSSTRNWLRGHNVVLAYIVLVFSVFVMLLTGYLLGANLWKSYRSVEIENRITANMFLTIAIIGFTLSIISTCCTSCFLVGIKKHKPCMMLPYVVMGVIGFMSCIMFFAERVEFYFLLPALFFVYLIIISCGLFVNNSCKGEEEAYDVRYNSRGGVAAAAVETEIP